MASHTRILLSLLLLSILGACSNRRYGYLSTVRYRESNHLVKEHPRKLPNNSSVPVTLTNRLAFVAQNNLQAERQQPSLVYSKRMEKTHAGKTQASHIDKLNQVLPKRVVKNRTPGRVYSYNSTANPGLGEQIFGYGILFWCFGAILWLLELAGAVSAGSGFLGLGLVLVVLCVPVILIGLFLKWIGV